MLGAAIGLNSALIAIITDWLSDIKLGYCSHSWWLNQKFCCWEIEEDGKVKNKIKIQQSNLIQAFFFLLKKKGMVDVIIGILGVNSCI